MPLDLGLVPHAADREAEKALIEGSGDGTTDARLADPGRTDKAEDGALGILLELAHREILEDAILDVLEPVVIVLEDILG